MATSTRNDIFGSRKKRPAKSSEPSNSPKRSRTNDAPTMNSTLIGPHKVIITELAPKFDVLTVSVISSTQIRNRVSSVTRHLLGQTDNPRIALLHARTAEVCKLITVVEHCKRVLSQEGKTWYQYNQLFDQPEKPKKRDIVEETVLQNEADDDDDDDDDFEVMHSRFEDAVLPQPSRRTVKSLRIFISIAPVPELKSKEGTTLQSSQERKR